MTYAEFKNEISCPQQLHSINLILISAYVVAMKKQLELNFDNGSWGGKRKNSGRKRFHSRGVSHDRRATVKARTPVHINFKVKLQVRNKEGLKALRKAIQNARKYVSVIHYSLQSNHVHLIIEANNNERLTQGMRSLTITFSKCLDKGRIQKERYHLHILKSVRETRNAIQYVIFNEARHSGKKTVRADLFTSLHLLPIRDFARKFSIVKERINDPFILDQPSTWLSVQGLKPS